MSRWPIALSLVLLTPVAAAQAPAGTSGGTARPPDQTAPAAGAIVIDRPVHEKRDPESAERAVTRDRERGSRPAGGGATTPDAPARCGPEAGAVHDGCATAAPGTRAPRRD